MKKTPRAVETAIQKPSDTLSSEFEAALSTVRSVRRLLDDRIARGGLAKGLTSDVMNLARALAAFGAEVRKREQHGREMSETLSAAEKAEIMCEEFLELPAAEKEKVRAFIEGKR